MLGFGLILIFLAVSTIEAIPDPQTMVHIQNYDGPIIVHSCCDQCRNHGHHEHHGNHDNSGKHGSYGHYHPCDTDCTCVTKHNCYPYTQNSCYPTGYCCSNQYCNDEVKVAVLDNNSNCNRYGVSSYPYQYSGYY